MKTAWKQLWGQCRGECLGLAFFFAWVYCTLYGCGLVTTAFVHWGLEYFWSATGLATALIGIVALVMAGRAKMPPAKVLAIAGAACAIAGSFAIWLGYFDHSLFWTMRVFAGVFCGAGFVAFAVVWYARLYLLDEVHIEYTVLMAFILSFALYCIILLLKVSAALVLVFDVAFAVLSAWLILKRDTGAIDRTMVVTTQQKRSALANYASLIVLIALLWFQIAYFRVLSTPDQMGDRFAHFLIAFFSSCVVATILFLGCIRASRHLNFTLIFRWPLPLFVLSYVVYFFDAANPTVRMVAYAINFAGMFGVQFGCWVSAPKYLRRTGENPLVMTLGIVSAQGVGIYVGFVAAMHLIGNTTPETFSSLSLLLITIVLSAAMLVGFNPRWYLNGVRPPQLVRPPAAQDDGDDEESEPVNVSLDELFNQQALALQGAYGLTERETEVAALLLAGRSRPYIRDELVISLNTVHAHARSIFAKCNVHSQQELLDLARSMATETQA